MTSYIEQIVDGLGNLAPIIHSGLAQVRSRDEITRNLLKAINKEEADLLEELKSLAKIGPDFDEESIKQKAQCLINRRREVSLILDDQNKFSIGIYQHLDQKIKDFDVSTKGIAHLLPDNGNTLDTEEARRKKKRKSSGSRVTAVGSSSSSGKVEQEDDLFDTHSVFDPNEPKYCKCRRVSFGSMVACENPECPIEWFHFECVGLKTEPLDPWFCPTCLEPPAKSSELEVKPVVAAEAPVATDDWKEVYEKMLLDTANATS